MRNELTDKRATDQKSGAISPEPAIAAGSGTNSPNRGLRRAAASAINMFLKSGPICSDSRAMLTAKLVEIVLYPSNDSKFSNDPDRTGSHSFAGLR